MLLILMVRPTILSSQATVDLHVIMILHVLTCAIEAMVNVEVGGRDSHQ